MYKKLALLISDRIEKSGIETKASAKVYAYGAEMLMSSLAGVITVVILSFLFGEPLAGFVYYVAYAFLRSSSGGFHASTHLKCYIMSLLCLLSFFALLVLIPPHAFFAATVAGTVPSAAVIFIMAPVGTPNKQLGAAEIKVYRKKCLAILACELVAIAVLLALGQAKYAYAVSNGFVLVALMLITGKISLSRYLKKVGKPA